MQPQQYVFRTCVQCGMASTGETMLHRGPCMHGCLTFLGCRTQHYEAHDLKLRRFVPIIRDSVVYPVILDSRRTVCSLPPIINAAMPAVCRDPGSVLGRGSPRHSQCPTAKMSAVSSHAQQRLTHAFRTILLMLVQITLETRDVFIECTATDLAKAHIVLNTVTTMFSEYCSAPFEVEPVEVVDALGTAQRARRLIRVRPGIWSALAPARMVSGGGCLRKQLWGS